MILRCEAAHEGKGTCEMSGAIAYPKCKKGFTEKGGICSPTCPAGFADAGNSCTKPACKNK